jgi:hypothetical protein
MNWYDYDLTSAYTTVMSMAGHPNYDGYKRLNDKELKNLSNEEFLNNYIIIHADFESEKELNNLTEEEILYSYIIIQATF